ncbi:sterol desaturase family protein [Novosphingobium mangrovi (ex Huang et al. 2023)]|uniref:Sterol desaturase family protein n=1 Tax=Novosphingobium mangrovi (ex Huang et al. 2023) TaxID=2976432 RepID=A0ABT2I416_9SPHN|nr:sterol desaturase family protein [Novosphingobium mangrovi (ex Huang et al. 2023)]MCT2399549.1 sterol desaturase family protein [Novosphingobium mangrovi (ex Huang et al. 2023)]
MDEQPVSSAAHSNEMQSVSGDGLSSGNPELETGLSATRNTESAAGKDGKSVKNTLVNLLPPATVAGVILFWAFGPEAWTGNPWSIVVAGGLITAFVQALEWVVERHAGWRLNKREFATDFFYVILGYTVISWVSEALAEAPLRSIKESYGITTGWVTQLPFLVQVAMVIFLIEFGQYWMHRIMHNWHPFWLTHAPHHHITQLNAMKGYVGNPIELFLISLSVVALFDFEQTALFCAFNVLGVVSTYAHANVRSDPPLFYSFFFTTIRHHSLHHSTDYESTRCNYANSLIVIDRALGTYREGEASVVGQDERKRLSIWEQFMFPFQPMIDWLKSKRHNTGHTAN